MVQFSSVTQLCPTLCDPMNCSTPGLPVQVPGLIYQEIKMLSSFFENIACNYIRSFVYFDLTRISH